MNATLWLFYLNLVLQGVQCIPALTKLEKQAVHEAQLEASAAGQVLQLYLQHRPPMAEGLSNRGVLLAAAYNGLLHKEHAGAPDALATTEGVAAHLTHDMLQYHRMLPVFPEKCAHS
jgi:hypothetical protein